MNTTEILAKIKTLLGVENEEVKLAQMKLEDKITIVESENFEAGDELTIITEDGKVAMPVGDYKLEDGRLLVVKEEGVIDHVKGEEKEEEKEVVEEKEEVVEKEMKEKEEYSEENNTPKKVVETISKELHFEEVEKLKKEIEDLKLKATEKEVELKEDLKEETKEDKTEEVELSSNEEPKPIVHNPENKKEIEGFKYGQGGFQSTLDRVMSKLSK
jgi:(p)ppGpp synthase/HD superfamily hydrolase